MKKIFDFYFFLGLISCFMVFFIFDKVSQAQLIDKPSISLTKADYYYTATSTAVSLLSETDLIKVKEEYNNTQEIVNKLQELKLILQKIEKNTR